MYDTCYSCHAIAQPEWDRCRICGADLSPAAREAVRRQATAPPGPPDPQEERDRKVAYISIGVTGIALALGFVAFLVISSQSGRTASELEEATHRVMSTLPPVSSTTTTTLPQSSAAETLGITLPANSDVMWQQQFNVESDKAQFRAWAEGERLKPIDVDLWEGVSIGPDGPDVMIGIVKTGAGQDVRSDDYMRYGIARPGYETFVFYLAGRPVAHVPDMPGSSLAYLVGVTPDTLVLIKDTGESGAAGLNKVLESIVAANP